MKNKDLEMLGWQSWGAYFINIAKAVAGKALDDRPVGAVLVKDNLILATGFNGFPRKIPSKQEAELVMKAAETDDKKLKDGKNGWVVHAEQNAIFNAARQGIETVGAIMYVTNRPCFACQKALVQAGVTDVFVGDMTPWKHEPLDPDGRLSKYLADRSGLQMRAVEDAEPESGEAQIPLAKSS